MTTTRTYLPHALFIAGLALFAIASVVMLHVNNARAAGSPCATYGSTYVPLTGYAWAGFDTGDPSNPSGPGWISFSGTATDVGNTPYSVCEDGTTGTNPGKLAGYAWSSTYGWIDFGGATADASHPAPSVNLSTGEVSGWARVVSATAPGASAATGGWDGWIDLSGNATGGTAQNNPSCPDGASYCLVQGAGCTDWGGYAWGNDDVGWVSANETKGTANAIKCGAPLTPITASCVVSPAVGTTNTPFTWAASASGGSGSYTYSWSGTSGLSGSGSSVTKTYSSTGSQSGTVTVTDANFPSASASATCTNNGKDPNGNPVASPPPSGIVVYQQPTASLTASKTTITNGQQTTLSWVCGGGSTTYTGNGFNDSGAAVGSNPLSSASGNVAVSPSSTTSYGVTCSNPGGSASDSQTITVIQPNVSITADPPRVSSGSPVTITWSSSSTNGCTVASSNANDANFPQTGISGSQQSAPITSQTVFKITCTTNGCPVFNQNDNSCPRSSIIVNILPVFQEF